MGLTLTGQREGNLSGAIIDLCVPCDVVTCIYTWGKMAWNDTHTLCQCQISGFEIVLLYSMSSDNLISFSVILLHC